MEQSKTKTSTKTEKIEKYTFQFEDSQEIEEHLSKATWLAFGAVYKGLGTYLKEREQSLDGNSFGAITNVVPNVAKGVKETLVESSEVLPELAEAFTKFITFPLKKKSE